MAGNDRSRRGDAALVAALSAGLTLKDAATRAGISERTAQRRMADPDFREKVAAAGRETVERALNLLAAGAVTAAAALVKIAREGEGEHARIQAARAILLDRLRIVESTELAARIDELAALLAEQAPATNARGKR